MTQRILRSGPARTGAVFTGWMRGWFIPALKRRRILGAAFIASLMAAIYWGVIASDRYVSEAHIIIQKTDLTSGQGFDVGTLLANGGGNHADQLLLRDYLLSVDMLQKLDAKLGLRAHYSDWHRDPLSRMWFEDTPLEKFYRYYLTRISVEYDDYAGILIVRAQAYDPKMARAITTMLLEEGERHMNAMAHSLALNQVTFLENQANELLVRLIRSRQAVVDYQNNKGTISPQGTAENLAAIINSLEGQRAELQTRRSALLGYLVPNSSSIIELNHQIAAIDTQLKREQAKLSSNTNKVLNSTVEEYQRLQMSADFAQELYKTALTALEKGRIEASRTLKKVTMLQTPTEPQYPLEPRRLYNTIVFILVTLLLAGIAHLLGAIIRDHKD